MSKINCVFTRVYYNIGNRLRQWHLYVGHFDLAFITNNTLQTNLAPLDSLFGKLRRCVRPGGS